MGAGPGRGADKQGDGGRGDEGAGVRASRVRVKGDAGGGVGEGLRA